MSRLGENYHGPFVEPDAASHLPDAEPGRCAFRFAGSVRCEQPGSLSHHPGAGGGWFCREHFSDRKAPAIAPSAARFDALDRARMQSCDARALGEELAGLPTDEVRKIHVARMTEFCGEEKTRQAKRIAYAILTSSKATVPQNTDIPHTILPGND